MDKRGRQLLDGIMQKASLPSLSPLAVRLMSLAADENSAISDLAHIIEADPALTTRLLKLVNSGMFRISESEVTSIKRAVGLLGFREVRIMALSLSLRDTVPIKKTDNLDYGFYWRLSLQRAILSQLAAKTLGLPNGEESFIAGLILEIGLPVLLRALPVEVSKNYPGLQSPYLERMEWESKEAGINHRELGAVIVEHCRLPAIFADCMLERNDRGKIVKVVAFAQLAVEACFLPKMSFMRVYNNGQEALGFTAGQINQVIGDALALCEQVATALEIDVDQEQDMLLVMEKANEALSRLSSQVAPKLEKVAQRAAAMDTTRLQHQAITNTLEAVMHEIRNPLMSVGGFARRLAGQGEEGGNVRRYAQVIMDEASRLDKVLNQVGMLLAPVNPHFSQVKMEDVFGKYQGDEWNATWRLPPGHAMITVDTGLLTEALTLLFGYAESAAGRDNSPLLVNVERHEGRLRIFVRGSGTLAQASQIAMNDLAFGPDLNLVRIGRIVGALNGEFKTTAGQGNFTLELSVPDTPQLTGE